MDRRNLCVYTSKADGSSRFYLEQLGILTGQQLGTLYPGGASKWQANLHVDPALQHSALTAGRWLTVTNGGSVAWRGRLGSPVRGEPWQLQATGIGSLASYTASIPSTGTNAYALSSVIPAAVGRGALPWINLPSSFSYPSAVGTAMQGSISIDQAISDMTKATGTQWRIARDGSLFFESAPTVPTLLLQTPQPLATTLVDYFTYCAGIYQTSSTVTAMVTYTNTAAEATFGHVEAAQPYDMTSLGVITGTTANAYLQAYVNANAPRLKVTDPIMVSAKQLLTLGGVPVDFATVAAGVVVRAQQVTIDSQTSLADPTQELDLLIGETLLDVDSWTLTLTPTNAVGGGFAAAVGRGGAWSKRRK